MNPIDKTVKPLASQPGFGSTETDGPASPAPTASPSDETGEFTAGAAAGYRRCLEIREKLATDPKARIPLIDLMVVRVRCGQHARAAAIANDLVVRPPNNEMIYFQSACGFTPTAGAVRDRQSPARLAAGGAALAAADEALIRRYTDRAIDGLRKGKARGFADVVGLETDPDLEPIRDDPAFRALVAEFPRPAASKP